MARRLWGRPVRLGGLDLSASLACVWKYHCFSLLRSPFGFNERLAFLMEMSFSHGNSVNCGCTEVTMATTNEVGADAKRVWSD